MIFWPQNSHSLSKRPSMKYIFAAIATYAVIAEGQERIKYGFVKDSFLREKTVVSENDLKMIHKRDGFLWEQHSILK